MELTRYHSNLIFLKKNLCLILHTDCITFLFNFRLAEIPFNAYWGSVFLCTIRFILSLISLCFAHRLPRRMTYISCCILSSIATSLIACYFFLVEKHDLIQLSDFMKIVPILCIILMYISQVFALGSIPYMLQSEILPLQARSLGSGLIGFFDYFSLFVSIKIVPSLIQWIGMC